MPVPPSCALRGRCVGLFGPLPPPRGGISLYVERLARRLLEAGARVVVISTNGSGDVGPGGIVHHVPHSRRMAVEIARCCAVESIELVHAHTFGCGWRELAHFVLARRLTGLPLVVSQHSCVRTVESFGRVERVLLRATASALDAIIASGRGVHDKLLAIGIDPRRLVLLSPYIAPPRADLELARWPPEIAAVCARKGPLVVSGTGRLVDDGSGDLYGLDVFVRAARRVLEHLPDAGFIYAIGHEGDADLLEAGRAYVRHHDLSSAVCIYLGPAPAPALWAAGDIKVRPTLDDGDAVSVREAMGLGTPTIASDAVPRPPGCRTHRSADPDDLARVIFEVAADLPAARRETLRHRPAEAVDELLALYGKLLGQRPLRLRLARGLLGRRSLTSTARGAPGE